jgi:uncharacterized repeat protein (TIGR02543 family)
LILNKNGTFLYSCLPSLRGELIIPNGVTYINQSALLQCKNISSVIIPNTMRTITMRAFDSCSSLNKVTISEGTTAIEYMAFANCPNLKEVYIPASVVTFEPDVFKGSTQAVIYGYAGSAAQSYALSNGIAFITIQNNKHSIFFDAMNGNTMHQESYFTGNLVPSPAAPSRGGYVFTGWYRDAACTSLWDFDNDIMPNNDLTLYAGWRVENTDFSYEVVDDQGGIIHTASLGEGYTTQDAWDGASITIKDYSGGLSTLVIPDTIAGLPVTAIADYAFADCDLNKITIPASVTNIGDKAFYGCENLAVITVASGNPSYTTVSNVLFNANQTKLLRYAPVKSGTSYTIPSTVTSIGSYAFYACEGLTSITLPTGMQSIGENAFENCTGLLSLTFPNNVTTLGSSLFNGCDPELQLYGPVATCAIKTYAEANYLDYNLYTVNYYNGADNFHSQQVRAGDLVPEIQEPMDDILRFDSWCKTSDLTTVWNPETDFMPAADLDLYLRWKCDYTYTGTTTLTITGYTGTDNFLRIPSAIQGKTVTKIAAGALNSTAAKPYYEIMIPSTVTSIASGAITWESEDCKPELLCDSGSAGAAYATANGLVNGAIQYAVNYQANGGRAIATQNVAPGALLTVPTTLRDNYTLDGWFSDESFTQPWDFATSTMPTQDITLYAKWTIVDANIPPLAYTYESANGEVTVTGYIGTKTFATIPSSINGEPVTAIADFFLQDDNRVQKLTIPSSVTMVGDYAFQDSILAEVVFESGGSTLTIGNCAFYGCNYLTSVTIPRTMTTLSAHLFHGCTGLLSLDLPDGITIIDDGTFYGCANLRSLTLPATVTSIGTSAFAECYALRNVIFLGTPPTGLKSGAFRYTNTNLILLYQAGTSGWSTPTYTYTDEDETESVFNTAEYGSSGYISSLTPSRERGVLGQPIKWTAAVAGTTSAMEYQFTLYQNEESEPIATQAFTSSNTFTYTPATVGSYRVIAVAKDTEENMTSPRSSSVNITTKVVPVNSVSLNYETLSMNPDDMQQLTASVLPLDATDQTLKWTSSNPNVASVSASGVVTAIAMGSTTITATSTSGVKAECVVTTTIRMVPQLVLKATSHEVIAENSFTITVQYRYFDVLPTLINWQSSDTTIATVDAAGKVTCLKPGAVKIRATANDEEGTFAEFDLTVLPIPVSQITVSVGNGMLAVGANKQYSFTISPENASDKSVVWSIVSGEIYASIDETRGFLTGISPGSVVIRATAADGSDIYGEATIQVVDYKVQISGKSEVLAGKTLQLTSSLLPSNLTNTNVVWSLKIGDSAYASISTTGLVTAKALTHRQTITVIASSKDGAALQAEKQITIYPVTTAIQILNNDVNVTGQTLVLNSNAAESLTFTSAMIPSDASIGVSWTMSATTSASLEVTNEGKSAVISPIAGKSGKITLTAKANDGSGKTAVVYIQVAVLSSGVTVSDPKSGVLYSGKSTQLVATFTDPQPSNKAVKWVLSPEYDTFATLSATGLLTAKAVTEAAVIKVVAVPLDGGPESAPYEVTIKPYTSSMQILRGETYVTNTTLTVDFGHEDSLQLTAVAWPYSASQDVTFLSSIPSIATVDETGMVTVLKTGLVSITAKATDGSGKLASVKLNIVKLPQQIEAVSPVLGLYGGSSATYRVKDAAAAANVILPASQVRWTLDGDCANIAKITTGGVLTTFAVNEQQTVTLKAEVIGNEEIANTTVDVTIYPTTQSIRLYKGEAPLTGAIIFDTYNLPDGGDDGVALSVLTIPEGAMQEMAWSSSNPAIATVTDGVVKPVWNNSTSAYNKGVATITAKTKDGTNLSVSATVQVLSLAQSVTLTTVSGETELISGASLQLKATLGNSSATNPKVYYSIVSGAEYATVSIGGLVTAKTVYKEEIIVVRATTAEGLSQDDLDLKILPKEADPLVIQPIDGSAPYNGTRQSFNIKSAAAAVQIAAIGYATGDPVIVKWTVSPSTIGKVSIIGGVATLQSITTGVVTVTATDAKGRTASFTAEFYKPATSLTITPPKGMDVAELKLSSGKTMQLTGVLAPTTGVTTAGVNWYIGVELEGAMKYYKDTNLASISSTGLVTAKAGLTTPATVKIYAVTKNAPYLTDSVDITILPAVTGVDILFDGEVANNKSYTMNLAVKTTNLSAIVWPAAANQSVTWTSSDKLIATIAADGTLTALKTGTVTITAKADGKISTFKLTISVLPTGIEITSKTGFEMRAGGTLQLAIAFTPTNATDKRVSWALLGDGAQFAKISSTGLVTAKAGTKQQTIDVKATSFADKNLTWTQKITIYPATTKVQILDTAENDVSGKTLILDLNEMTEMTLLAKNLPSMEGGARQGVTWKSSNTAVLRVAADGTLTPVRKSGSELYYTGTVTITATASDGSGKYASVKVFVGYLVTSITFADGLTVKGGYTLALKPTFEPINATNKAVKWTIKASDTPYATISSTGVITAKKLTEARDITIYCEALDGSGVIAEIKVNITM